MPLRQVIAQAIAAADSLVATGEQIVALVCDEQGWDLGEIWVHDGATAQFWKFAAWHRPGTTFDAAAASVDIVMLGLGEGLAGRVWATGQPVFVADLSAEIAFPQRELAARMGLHAALGIPMRADAEVIGAITLFAHAPSSVDADGLAYLATIGEQSGQVIQHIAARTALHASEERFRGAFDYAAIGMAIVTPAGRWLRVNRALCALLGYDEAELLATSVRALTHPDDIEANRRQVAALLDGLIDTYQLEQRYRHKDGHYLWALPSVSLVRDRLGAPRYLIAQVQGIDGRKRAERRAAGQVAVARILAEAASLDEAALTLLQTLGTSFGWLAGELFEVVGGETPLRQVASWYPDRPGAQAFGAAAYPPDPGVGVGLPGLIRSSGAPLWLADVAAEPRFLRQREAAAAGFRAACGLPIRSDGAVVGVLLLFDDAVRPVEPDDLETLGSIGAQISQFVERRRAEEALRRSEANLRAVIANAPVVLTVYDLDGRITLSEGRGLLAVGRRGGETVGQLIDAVAGDTPDVLASLHRARTGEESLTVTRIGAATYETRYAAMRDRSGAIAGTISVATDISERARAEETLRQERDFARQILAAMGQGVTVVDSAGSFVYVNPAFARILGWPAEDLLGHNPQEFVLPDDLPTLDDAVERRLRGEGNTYEVRLRRRDGGVVDALITATPRANDGSAIAVISDLTERKHAEAALREAHHLENSPVALVEWDADRRIVGWSAAAERTFGWRADDVVGRRVGGDFPFILAEDAPVANAAMARLLAGDDERNMVRLHNHTSDGRVVECEWYNSSLHDDQGRLISVMSLGLDITERQAAQRVKDELVSVVSHELRTPLTSIYGSLTLLASGLLDDDPTETRDLLGMAASNAERLVRLINDILDIERLGTGKAPMARVPCLTSTLAEQAIATVGRLAEEAGIALQQDVASVMLSVDPDRIVQVLINLLGNAVKFSPAGSVVSLRARRQGSQVVFAVVDRGRGVPVEQVAAIFEPFQQVDASDSREKGGTGLGLAICRSIVQAHGGRIWVESTLGQGSTFWVALPDA